MTGSNTFYNEQYNTRLGVDDVEGYFARWRADSEAARRDLHCYPGVAYGAGNRETIDLFPAAGSSRWLVFIHGGYWRKMASGDFSFIAPPFVQAGWNVALVEYDLCPAVTMPTITDQCRRALEWLYEHAAEYSVSCEEIIVSGHSAGGHLTAMMFATNWSEHRLPPEKIIGGVTISGLFDLDPIRQTSMNTDLRLSATDAEALSPSRLMPQVRAPLVLAVGAHESDEFHRQNAVLRGAPGWADITTETVSVSGYHHFNILDDFMSLGGHMWSAASFR